MSKQFLELENGGWLNVKFVISIEPAASMGFVARYQVGDSVETARIEPESVEDLLKTAVFAGTGEE